MAPIFCFLCSSRQDSPRQLSEHFHQNHADFECQICEGMFFTKEKFERHKSQFHPKIVTKKEPKDEPNSKKVVVIKLRKESNKVPPKSEIGWKSKEILKTKNVGRGVCMDCGRYFQKISTFRTHLQTLKSCNRSSFIREAALNPQQKEYLRKFSCNICNKTFPREERLKRHLKKAGHSYKCDKCGIYLARKKALEYHLNKCKIEKSFDSSNCRCSFCDKLFQNEQVASFHEHLNHKDISKYSAGKAKCLICKQKFLNLTLLKRHFTKHHEAVSCKTCNAWMSESELTNHNSICSQMKDMKENLHDSCLTEDGKRVKSAICDPGALETLSSLKKPNFFICENCDRCFLNGSSFTSHLSWCINPDPLSLT